MVCFPLGNARSLISRMTGLKLKALVADPKSKSKPEAPLPPVGVSYPLSVISYKLILFPVLHNFFYLLYMYDQPMSFPYPPELATLPAYSLPGYLPQSRQRLFVVCHKSVSSTAGTKTNIGLCYDVFTMLQQMKFCDFTSANLLSIAKFSNLTCILYFNLSLIREGNSGAAFTPVLTLPWNGVLRFEEEQANWRIEGFCVH